MNEDKAQEEFERIKRRIAYGILFVIGSMLLVCVYNCYQYMDFEPFVLLMATIVAFTSLPERLWKNRSVPYVWFKTSYRDSSQFRKLVSTLLLASYIGFWSYISLGNISLGNTTVQIPDSLHISITSPSYSPVKIDATHHAR